MMKILLRESSVDINATDWLGRTPLSYSASNSDPFPLNMLQRRRDIDVNIGDTEGQTPLYFVVIDGRKRAIKSLLADSRVNPNLVLSVSGFSPLIVAII